MLAEIVSKIVYDLAADVKNCTCSCPKIFLAASLLRLANGDIAILNVDREVVVKQVFRRDERLLLVSHNPDFAPREVHESLLIGVLMWCRRMLKR